MAAAEAPLGAGVLGQLGGRPGTGAAGPTAGRQEGMAAGAYDPSGAAGAGRRCALVTRGPCLPARPPPAASDSVELPLGA